jgi:Peptidase family M23
LYHHTRRWRRLASVGLAVALLTLAAAPAARAATPARKTVSLGVAPSAKALAEGQDPICSPDMSFNVKNEGVRGVNTVNYGGTLDCNFNLDVYAYTYLIERTSGTSNDGKSISSGSVIDFKNDNHGISVGQLEIDGRTYEGGRKVEVGFYLVLHTRDGTLWNPCGEIGPDLHYLVPCKGEGTDTLTVEIGAGVFDTGLGPYASLPVPREGPGSVPKSEYARPHHDYAAIDIRVVSNTPVYAVKAGTVSYTSSDTGDCGIGVYVRADNIYYLYCHFTSRSVASGAQVLAGDRLGYSGDTGSARGHPHLHFELRTGRGTGTRYCPQNMLTAIHERRTPPLPQQLPTTGCFYKSVKVKTDKTSYHVGESPLYTVNSEVPYSPIYWSSTRNGVSTGEVLAFYGQYTDGDGNWSGYGGAWTDALVGSWTKTIALEAIEGGLIEDTVAFAVTPVAALTMDRTTYSVGDVPLYTVRNAPPNAPIYWSSTRNGVSTGEVNAFYGQYTDANGNFSAYGGAWRDIDPGTWTKTVSIGGQTSTFGFSVIASP